MTWLFAHGHQPSPHQMHRMEAFLGSRAPLPDGWEGDLHFCFLKHMQMECIQCLGGSSQPKSCLATGCQCCQSEFVKKDPMQVDGKWQNASS